MPKKIDKKICLLAAVFAGALIWLAFFLQLGKIREMSDNIQKEQLDSLIRQERSQKILEMGKELGDVEKNKNDMRVMLVDKDNAVPFLKTLEAIAAETGNEIKISVTDLSKMKSQSAQAPVAQESDASSAKDIQQEDQAQKAAQAKAGKPDFSNQLGFSIELSGKYGSLIDFFTKLENMPYFAQVYNFQIAPVAKSQTVQAAGSEVASTSPPTAGPAGAEGENKNIKSTLTIGVYTNGTK
ncbi:MAG: hypothetical protein NT170_02990 [Candidatus Moranbacteria bacterium]|nr:hypothetical protein [Candidatus Moranbacteria bacterium]